MSSYNINQGYSQNAKQINDAQQRYANLSDEYNASVLGDPKARDQDMLRQAMFKVQNLLGTVRQFTQWLVQESKQTLDANKNTIELAKV